MNTAKQFRALFKFQTSINPTIWILPLVFGIPLLLPFITSPSPKAYHPSFFSLFVNQNIFFVGIFGAMILAPEKFQFGALASNYSGSEFLFTRAIDRPILYRAKATLLYVLILILPVFAIIHSLNEPNLIVNEYSNATRQACLSSVPGSTQLPPQYENGPPSLISIPRGNILVAEWQFLIFLATALFLQLFILILYPLKHAKIAFWALFFGFIFVPLFDSMHRIGKDEVTPNEQLFFSFASHQTLFWIFIATAFVLSQLWCERRFARLEQ